MREFIGREAEQAAIAAWMTGVMDGPAALVMCGTAGIGKTVLWEEALRLAQERSYRVLSCRPAKYSLS